MSHLRLRETFADPFETAFRRLFSPVALESESPSWEAL
mgnify:CR=1 FL=1